MNATPGQIWAHLCDGWIFPCWVVGAVHIRDVDADWPQPGSRLHHKVGGWPIMISDHTEVVEADAPRRLVLQARAWPTGEARIVLTLAADGTGATVTMAEKPTHGPGHWLDNPVQRFALRRRNVESLERLACIAENRPVPGPPAGPAGAARP